MFRNPLLKISGNFFLFFCCWYYKCSVALDFRWMYFLHLEIYSLILNCKWTNGIGGLCLAGGPAALHGRNYYIGHYKTLIHDKKKAIFHCKTEGYNPNQDALHQLARHQQTIIFRLRTGHCRLNSHLKRIGVKTSAQCPCGEADQTPEHYLQSCSLHQQARQQIWPTCVSLKTKL